MRVIWKSRKKITYADHAVRCRKVSAQGSIWVTKNQKKEKLKMSVISMKQLLEAGVHFGHQTRRWNPKMKPYIYTERNGIYIIDLQKSVGMVDDAYNAVADIVKNGGKILFVGTKKQAQDAIRTAAERCRDVKPQKNKKRKVRARNTCANFLLVVIF